ncbi:MAG: hypothetical protein ABFR90_09405 [Planctomycetota bacterium]
MHWKIILILIAGSCFCVSSAAYIFVKFALRPKDGQAWEQEHWDFEDEYPAIKRYHFWCRFLFSTVVVSMLLLFIVISV